MGSASELEYHLLLAGDLGFLEKTRYERLYGKKMEVKQMLASFIKKLKAES
jgi:four helix bundle protein